MAYALASKDNVLHQLVSVLNAHPGVWSPNVQTSPSIGAWPSDLELDLAVMQADEEICTSGYFQSVNDSLTQPFEVTSAPMVDQDPIPFHHGSITKTEVSKTVLSLTQAAINTTTDIITYAGHGMATGDIVTFILVSGALPTCDSPTFAELTNYYVIKVTANTFKLARTLAQAIAGTAIDILTAPTGVYLLADWIVGVKAAAMDDMLNAKAVGSDYVGAGAFDFLYRHQDGQMYITAQYGRITYPEYVRTSELQSRQSEEFLVTCGAVSHLVKNASPSPFQYYQAEFLRGIAQLVADGIYVQQPDTKGGSN